eukprot:jgi/Hompol1/4684/HPOL_001800-RA
MMRDKDTWADSEPAIHLELLRRLFEWTRNACAGTAENQALACESQVYMAANHVLLEIVEYRNGAEQEICRQAETFGVRISTFMLHADEASIKYALIWIYNCTLDNPAQCYACIKNLLVADMAPRIWSSIEKIEETHMSVAHVALLKALDGLTNAGTENGMRFTTNLPLTNTLIVDTIVATTERFKQLYESSDPLIDATAEHYSTFIVLMLQYLGVTSQIAQVEEKIQWVHAGIAKALMDLREYALFALRNLTKANLENQQLIASLEAKKVVPNAMLDQLGVQIEIDRASGKVKYQSSG